MKEKCWDEKALAAECITSAEDLKEMVFKTRCHRYLSDAIKSRLLNDPEAAANIYDGFAEDNWISTIPPYPPLTVGLVCRCIKPKMMGYMRAHPIAASSQRADIEAQRAREQAAEAASERAQMYAAEHNIDEVTARQNLKRAREIDEMFRA